VLDRIEADVTKLVILAKDISANVGAASAKHWQPFFIFWTPTMQCLIRMVFWVIQMTLRSFVKRTPQF
jgi:hypothetical protein